MPNTPLPQRANWQPTSDQQGVSRQVRCSTSSEQTQLAVELVQIHSDDVIIESTIQHNEDGEVIKVDTYLKSSDTRRDHSKQWNKCLNTIDEVANEYERGK